jgi:hypothetical protein
MALPVEADEPLGPVLVLSPDDIVGPRIPPLPQPILDALPVPPPLPADKTRSASPVLDALPVPPPLPEVVLEPLPVREPLTLWRMICAVVRAIHSAVEWVFGVATLIVGLAFLAAIPIVGILSLGYLLETGGRIARNAAAREARVRQRVRWRISRFFLNGWLALGDGLVGVRKAARVGGVVLGVALIVVPLQLMSSFHVSAQVIDPAGAAARQWQVALTALTVAAFFHIVLACLHGGRLHYFLWPVGNLIWLVRRLPGGRFYTEPRDAVWDFVVSLRLPYYFWLGLRGGVGALIWLVVPLNLIAAGRVVPPIGLLGALLFGMVLLVLPFLQMHFAAQNRFAAMFDMVGLVKRFSRAPWAFAFAQFVALLLSVPLYLFKIELIPREVGGIPSVFFVMMSLVFVAFIYPTRLVAGWAYARSEPSPTPRGWLRTGFFSVTGLLAMIPGTAIYVGFVFLTQFTSWNGFRSLYEQHTFLLPVPFWPF